jgi:hypothetical protein
VEVGYGTTRFNLWAEPRRIKGLGWVVTEYQINLDEMGYLAVKIKDWCLNGNKCYIDSYCYHVLE